VQHLSCKLSLLLQHMANEDEAKRAIAELNGCTLNGNRLNVEVIIHMSECKTFLY